MTVRRRRSVREQLDRLIDFYDQHDLERGKPVPVHVAPAELARILGKIAQPGFKIFRYRGRDVIATGRGQAEAQARGRT